IERRMGLKQIDDVEQYLETLRTNPEEAKHLAKDLLISVTSYFRDPEAFTALEEQVIAPLVRGKERGAVIRVWVPGCATGEEAYSLAMLLDAQLDKARKDCRLQVFGTDLDEEALEIARRGVYPDSIAADMTSAQL